MDEKRARRLEEKYKSTYASGSRTMNIMPRRANMQRGMNAKGKPKDMKKTVLRLVSYLKKERVKIVLSLIFSVINTVSTLGASYMLRPLINRFISAGDLPGLLRGILFMALVYAVSVLTSFWQQRIMLSVSQKSLCRMRKDLYEKLEKLPIAYFDQNSPGDIMSRFTNDVDAVGQMLSSTLIQMISGAITIFGTVFLMVFISPALAAITIFMSPVLVLASKTIIKYGRGAYKVQQTTLGVLNGFAEETVSGQKIVKVFNHEEMAAEEFSYLNEKLCDAQIKAQFRAGIMGPVTHQICNLIYGVTACIGGLMVALRGFDVGGLTVILNFTRHFNRPINEISMQINTVFSALAGAERVFEVMDEKEEKTIGKKDVKIDGHITVENLSFGYKEGILVLKNISLAAAPGQKIAFVGSTGAGKTTITNLLTAFYEIKDGAIKFGDTDIREIDKKVLRKNVAMVLQDTHLFTGTVMENIRYGRKDASDDEVIAAAKVAFAHGFISQLESGYKTVLENDGANLSEGQRQLLNIARAVISKAPILILDEATSSVDTMTEQLIEDGLSALMKNRTTFIIAHRLSTVKKADRIMVLEHGEIIESGTHTELLKRGGRYADLYNEIIELD